MRSFFPRDVLDEILNLMESVSEGFPTYSFIEIEFAIFISLMGSLLPKDLTNQNL